MNNVDPIAKDLVKVLLDETAREDERDDAAMDLYKFNGDYVTNALAQVGRDSNVEFIVRDSCGESLAKIWTRNENFDLWVYNGLTEEAKCSAYRVIQYVKPEWIEQYKLSWPPV